MLSLSTESSICCSRSIFPATFVVCNMKSQSHLEACCPYSQKGLPPELLLPHGQSMTFVSWDCYLSLLSVHCGVGVSCLDLFWGRTNPWYKKTSSCCSRFAATIIFIATSPFMALVVMLCTRSLNLKLWVRNFSQQAITRLEHTRVTDHSVGW